jgi:hypothetical protein
MVSDIIYVGATFSAKVSDSILKFGNIITGLSQPAITFITAAMIGPITTPTISNVLLSWSTLAAGMASRAESAGSQPSNLRKLPLLRGTVQQRVVSGIPSTSSGIFSQSWISAFLRFVRSAGKIIKSVQRRLSKGSFVGARAKRVRCVVVEDAGRADVYCLTVPATGCFAIEGGLIVSNCGDDWRYACMSRPWVKSLLKPETTKFSGYAPARSSVAADSAFKVM